MRRIVMVTLTLAGMLYAGIAHADVRTEEKTQLRFEGALGRVLNLFGGRAMRDGVVSTVAVKGGRKMTVDGDTGQLIDLDEEKLYDIDFKNRTYRVTTFAEVIRQMEDARAKAAEQAPRESAPAQTADADQTQPQYDVDFDMRESGQRRAVNGFDAREVVMTITVRQKDKTLEESGGFVTTSNIWLAAEVPGMQEVAEFDQRYAQKLLGPALLDPQQMAAAISMYPMMAEAMSRMDAEKVNMDGTAVLTTTRFDAVVDAASARADSQPAQQAPAPAAGLGGLGGRLARRIAGGDRNNATDAAPAAPAEPGRATVMSMQQEILKVEPRVNDADVALPEGFRERR